MGGGWHASMYIQKRIHCILYCGWVCAGVCVHVCAPMHVCVFRSHCKNKRIRTAEIMHIERNGRAFDPNLWFSSHIRVVLIVCTSQLSLPLSSTQC